MRAVDTNVLVRLTTRDDPKQVALAEAFVAPGAWVSHLVLMESVWVLGSVYDLDRGQIAIAVDMLLGHKQLAVQDPDTVATALGLYRKRKGISFSDCLFVEVARKAGHLPLGTFDRRLGKLDGAQAL